MRFAREIYQGLRLCAGLLLASVAQAQTGHTIDPGSGTFRVVLVMTGDQGSQFINAVLFQQFFGDNRAGWDPNLYYNMTADYARGAWVYSVDVPAMRSSLQMSFNYGDSSGWQQTIVSDANLKAGGVVYVVKGPQVWGSPYNRSSVLGASGQPFDPVNQDGFPGLPSSTDLSSVGGSSDPTAPVLDGDQFTLGFALGLVLFGSWLGYYMVRKAGEQVAESP